METTTRTAYKQDKPYPIKMPAPAVVRQAILDLKWPPEGMMIKDTIEKLAEDLKLNEEQKTAVRMDGFNFWLM